MARNRGPETEAVIARRLAEGRGSGHLADYKPWLTVQDISSLGKVSRVQGYKTGRLHHFLSDGERDYFLIADWAPSVIDIREQFPLLPREKTIEICEHLRIAYPVDPRTRVTRALTTDFLIDLRVNGVEMQVARSFKKSDDLASDRTVEKLEIERLYWESQGIDWAIVTEKELPATLVANLEWLQSHSSLDEHQITASVVTHVEECLREPVAERADRLRHLCNSVDERLALSPGTSLTVVKHLIARRLWIVDMQMSINPNAPLSVLKMSPTPLAYDAESQRSLRVA